MGQKNYLFNYPSALSKFTAFLKKARINNRFGADPEDINCLLVFSPAGTIFVFGFCIVLINQRIKFPLELPEETSCLLEIVSVEERIVTNELSFLDSIDCPITTPKGNITNKNTTKMIVLFFFTFVFVL